MLESRPLLDLVGDNEKGWLVSRNPQKVLNHLSLLQEKKKLEEKEQLTPEEQKEYLTVGHIEFHPSDNCNLSCTGCTYAHDRREPERVFFPLDGVGRLAELNPESVVIAGGGEPLLYSDNGKIFSDLLKEMRKQMPKTKFALITNGTLKYFFTNWGEISWVRISVDASTPSTYTKFRGKSLFERVIANFLEYLDTPIENVGMGFVYSTINIHEYVEFARFIYNLVRDKKPEKLHKVNIQYRPFKEDRIGIANPYKITPQQVQSTVERILIMTQQYPDMIPFLKEQTNIESFVGGSIFQPYRFTECNYSKIFRIVRADGELRPCCIRVLEPELSLGNILTDSPEKILGNLRRVYSCEIPYCEPRYCRWNYTNHLLEEGLSGRVSPSSNPLIQNDPMF